LFGLFSLKAQVNLVPNPSFEEYEDCPVSLADFSVSNWFIPKYSPDYYNSCATSSQTGVPDNWGGGGYAHSGEAYAGIIVWVAEPYSNVREFFSVKLNESLIPGKKYNVEFYVSLMDSLWFATQKYRCLFFS
jgi:OOP family OmpA-OmpF porin